MLNWAHGKTVDSFGPDRIPFASMSANAKKKKESETTPAGILSQHDRLKGVCRDQSLFLHPPGAVLHDTVEKVL